MIPCAPASRAPRPSRPAAAAPKQDGASLAFTANPNSPGNYYLVVNGAFPMEQWYLNELANADVPEDVRALISRKAGGDASTGTSTRLASAVVVGVRL